jgi:hypothetical protein
MPRSEERGGMAARSVAEEQKSSWFKKPRPEGRGSLLVCTSGTRPVCLVVFSVWFIWLVSFNQPHETDRIDQIDQTDQMNQTGWRAFSASCR